MKNKNIGIILILLIIILVYFLLNNINSEGFQSSSLKQYNIIFSGTVKNVEKYIKNNLKNIDKCGSKFNKYLVIIYENDSTDKTRKILEENKKDNYIYIFENDVKEPLRTKRIAHGRNKILDKVREIYNEYDFLVMLDLDDVNSSGKFVDSIDSCFKNMDWDVLTGNQSDKYYDIWAFRKKGLLEFDCWKEYSKATKNGMSDEEAKQKYVYGTLDKFIPSEKFIEVDSAFSGIAIYKLNSKVLNCNYIGEYEDGSELCEHVSFHQCIKKNSGKIFLNTQFLTN